MPLIQLGYWNIRGLAQVARLLAAYTGLQIEDKRYSDWNQWYAEDKKKLGLDFPNLPYLIDGKFKLTESGAINQYIIMKSGKTDLLGKSPKDRAQMDGILGVLKDGMKEIKELIWNKNYANLTAAALEKVKVKFNEIQKFIGDKKFALGYLTLADFEITEASYYFQALYPKEYSDWSFWETIRGSLHNLPEIAKYYSRKDAMLEPFMPPSMVAINPTFRPTLTLAYWGIRGLAQQIRLLLSYVGLPFEEKFYKTPESWFQNDKKNLGLDFANIPYLIDGSFKVSESVAVQRYIISISNHKELLGRNIEEIAKIQSVMGVFADIWAQIAKNFWKEDKQVIKQTLEKITPKLDYLGKFIGQRNTVMENLSIADFYLGERSHYIETLFPEQSKKWKFMSRVRNTINNLASTKAYYAKQGSMKGPFFPGTAVLNPSYQQYL